MILQNLTTKYLFMGVTSCPKGMKISMKALKYSCGDLADVLMWANRLTCRLF